MKRKNLLKRKKELVQKKESLYQKQVSPTTGYPDYSRTDPFEVDIEKTKYEIEQIDLRLARRREVWFFVIGLIVGAAVTMAAAVIVKYIP